MNMTFDMARLWLLKGDSSKGFPAHTITLRGRDKAGRPQTRYLYVRWRVTSFPRPRRNAQPEDTRQATPSRIRLSIQGACGDIVITGSARVAKAQGGGPDGDIGGCLFGNCGMDAVPAAQALPQLAVHRAVHPLEPGDPPVVCHQHRQGGAAGFRALRMFPVFLFEAALPD